MIIRIPDIISALRILGAICLLFCDPAGVIVAIKIINQVSAFIACKRFCFPHTKANKLTGLLLFMAVPMVFWSIVPIAFVAGTATFAAVQEGHFIRTGRVEMETKCG